MLLICPQSLFAPELKMEDRCFNGTTAYPQSWIPASADPHMLPRIANSTKPIDFIFYSLFTFTMKYSLFGHGTTTQTRTIHNDDTHATTYPFGVS